MRGLSFQKNHPYYNKQYLTHQQLVKELSLPLDFVVALAPATGNSGYSGALKQGATGAARARRGASGP